MIENLWNDLNPHNFPAYIDLVGLALYIAKLNIGCEQFVGYVSYEHHIFQLAFTPSMDRPTNMYPKS